jgi:flagellar protein FliO/FliZ
MAVRFLWVTQCVVGAMILLGVQVAGAETATPPSFGNPLVTVVELLLSLGLIIMFIIVLIRFLASRSQVQQRGAIQVLAARQLAPNKSIQVVDIQGRTLVVGVGNDVTLLADVSNSFQDESEAAVSPTALSTEPETFGAMLADALQRLRSRNRPSGEEEETF